MPLSSELVSQFAKLASNKPKEEKESTVYGTTAIQNGNKYVKLDGSELLTPASFTTNIADGERVTVLIKNHMAIVTGNITSPAARTSEVEEVGNKANAIENDVNSLTSEVDEVGNKANAIENDVNSLTSEVEEVGNKANAIENDVNSLRGEIASEEIRYYLLQSSTLAAPEKPTTYPPPSTWVTTEPIYSNPDNDSDSLYFVVCTVYTNGEFKYSDVLISSTYESIRNTETRINQTKSSIDFSITEQINTVRTDYKTYTDNALNNYVTDADYGKDKKNTDDKMSDMEDALSNKATKDDLNGFATSEQYNEIRKYITFTKDGIKISSDSTYDNPDAKHLTLTLDNDAIKFENNGVVIGRWDGSNFYTGDIVVELNQRAQFGNFALVPRSDKSLMFLKVSD